LVVGGLTVAERAARQLARANGRVVIVTDGTLKLRSALPPSVEIHPIDPDVPGALEALLAALAAPAGTVVLPGDEVHLGGAGHGTASSLRVVDETTRRQAEDALFADLLRGDLGFIARHINKKISFRITRHVLCRLPVTPNQVTVASALVGFLGCVLIATGAYPAVVAGLVLAQLQSILDGCDGELARVRFQQSPMGEWLDTLMDDGLNVALVAAIGLGMYRAGWGAPALAAAGVICGMLLTYNAVSYRELVRQRLGGELLKIRWKINQGRDMKALWASPDGMGRGRRFVLTLGRRDTFVFAWMILGLLDLVPVILLWAFAVALPSFIAAVGQLVLAAPAARPGAPPPVR
jgi:phosphatidylglycerophosphate synthase